MSNSVRYDAATAAKTNLVVRAGPNYRGTVVALIIVIIVCAVGPKANCYTSVLLSTVEARSVPPPWGNEDFVDTNTRGALIGLATIIAVCGAVLNWVHHNSAVPMDFIERHLGFSPDGGDGSMEVLVFTVLVLIITTVALRWASK